MHRYAKVHFLPSTFEVHWLSIINGVVLVILLMIFLSYILVRTLNKDGAHAAALQSTGREASGVGGGAGGNGNSESTFDDLHEESGWRLLRDQVFRVPEGASWLSAIVGAGVQLLISCLSLLALALLGAFHPTVRGAVPTTFLFVYCFTGTVAGFVSGSLYKQMGEGGKARTVYTSLPTHDAETKRPLPLPGVPRAWFYNSLRTLFVFLLPSFVVFSLQNTVAWARASTSAIPARSLAVVLMLFVRVGRVGITSRFQLTFFSFFFGTPARNALFSFLYVHR